ncbi:hypothetical protein Tco_0254972 [Tanacetum coccineum]
MEISIADQIALDDALVAPADRLKIGKCNLRLSSDVTSKEATLQVVYDVLKLTPFYKAFQVTADAPEIYMQEFWASAYVHNRSVRFKMNNKKHILGLDQFRDILQICLKWKDGPNVHTSIVIFKELKTSVGWDYLPVTLTQEDIRTLDIQSDADSNEKAQDDEDEDKYDVHETTQDDEDDDVHGADENAQDDDDEEQSESEDDGDDFIHPKLTTHDDEIIHEEETDEDDSFDPTIHTPSHISSSDEEDSNNEVEGMDVEGTKSDDDDTYVEDQGNEVVEDTNANLEGRDECNDRCLCPSSSYHVGFVSNNVHPIKISVLMYFEQHVEATSLIDTPVNCIVEPFLLHQPSHSTPNPLVIQIQQPPILTPATTTSSSLQNLPNFASLFGFDYRLKVLEDNFSELRQTNQYAEALSSIPGTVDQYSSKIQCRKQWMNEEVMKEQVNKGSLQNLLQKSRNLNDKMEAKNLSTGQDIQRQLYKALVDALKPTKFCYILYGDRSQYKRLERGLDDDQDPPLETDRGSKKKKVRKRTASTSAQVKRQPRCRKDYSTDRLCIATIRESARDVYPKRRIIAVTKVEIVEWQNYKHLDWIIVRRDDDVLYKFKEGDFHRTRIKDIEDIGLSTENKDKKNRLMRIDELHKFSDGTLDDVRTALNDRLKGIRMEYLPQTFWSQRDKANARSF